MIVNLLRISTMLLPKPVSGICRSSQLLNTDKSERKKQCLGAYPQKVVLRRETKDSKSCFDLVFRSTVEDSLQRKPQQDRAVSENIS